MSFDHSLHMFRSPKLQSVVEDAIQFFMATPVHSLPPPSRFIGSGAYALYYHGMFYIRVVFGHSGLPENHRVWRMLLRSYNVSWPDQCLRNSTIAS